MHTLKRLQSRQDNGEHTNTAILGAGYVGNGVVHILSATPSVTPALVVNRNVSRAQGVYEPLGYAAEDVLVSNNPDELSAAIVSGKPAVTDDYTLILQLPIDLVIEATGAIDYGSTAILGLLDGGVDVISFNAEADALFAFEFHRRANLSGAIYTIADGDQPGAQLRIAAQVEAMGFEITAYINCKRHLNEHQNPESGAGYSSRDTTSARMTTSFGDGTKMQIEQAVVANITGCIPIQRGMLGIESTVEKAATDIAASLPTGKYVDFTRAGDFGAGVGVMARHSQQGLHKKALQLYKMGDGPDYFFFRSYHLVHLELPNVICDVVLDRQPLGVVDAPHSTEVIAIAKKRSVKGEQLDCIGGFSAYGHIVNAEETDNCLPMCLLEYAILTADVEIDQPIPLCSVKLDRSVSAVELWLSLQQQWGRNAAYLSGLE